MENVKGQLSDGQIENLLEDRLDAAFDHGAVSPLAQVASSAALRVLVRMVERSPRERAALLFRVLDKGRALEVFEALDAGHQADLVSALREDELARVFREMDPDDRVSLLDELPAGVASKLLRGLSASEREPTLVVLGYPKDSIGRHMSPEVMAVQSHVSAAAALDAVRARSGEVESVYTIAVTDEVRRLTGVISLRDLLEADPAQEIASFERDPVSARAAAPAEETARWFLPLGLLALPVVDDEGRLVGILTAEDARDIVEEADQEDLARGGGLEPLGQPYLTTRISQVVRSRVVWLLVLALSAVLTVHVLEIFEATLAQVVTLALFIPLLTGTAGNTGNQAATTVTRALALGDVRQRDLLRVLWREARVGMLLGALLGSLGFAVTSLLYGVNMGLVIGLTLFLVCAMAASVGGAIPIVAKMIKADPAVFSNPFISTFCDATGLLLYFLIAKLVLGV